jgi:hypothetical protein
MKPQSMERSIQRNRAISRLCEVAGCGKSVHQFGAFCFPHHKRRMFYGHAEATPLLRGELRPYRRAVDEFLRVNADHPAVIAAREFFEILLETSQTFITTGTAGRIKSSQKLAHHLAFAKREGVLGVQLLAEALTVAAFAEFQPRRFRSDQHRLFDLARRNLQVAPLCRRSVRDGKPVYSYVALGPTILRELSNLIHGRMAQFLAVAGQEVVKRLRLGPAIQVSEPFHSKLSLNQQVLPAP